VPITVDVQYASSYKDIPTKKKLSHWSRTCLESILENAEFTIRIVDEEEITGLNKTWRGINKATNVLSFPSGGNQVVPELIGDVVICAPIISREADEQNKDIEAHWAHMVIHGLLHLLGYDHIEENDAKKMESLEIEKLKRLNYPNPYE
jgi:probable rRNA maturation factor